MTRIQVGILCFFLGGLGFFSLGSGCGDGLVGEEYRGEPLFQFKGIIFSIMDQLPDEDLIRVAIAWIPRGEGLDLEEGVIDQNSISMTIQFPSSLDVNIFSPPGLEAFGEKTDYAWGYVIVYEDFNENRRFEPDELLGGSPNRGLLYAPFEIPAARSPTGGILPQGFSLLHLPFECGLERWRPEQECGVPLGASCTSSFDCNASAGGLCIEDVYGLWFPGGYCTMEAKPDGCEPKGGYPVGLPEMEFDYWMKTCVHTSDCRSNEGYSCSVTEGLCLPKFPVLIEINDELRFDSFCYQEEDEDLSEEPVDLEED